jgi:hypothetical protein
MWTVISGIFGGLLRLAPEILKYFNMKAEQAHELNMQREAYKFQELRGKQEVDIIKEKGAADYNTGALDALKTAIEGQDRPLPPSGNKFIDFLIAFANVTNKLIRPVITIQWVVILYPGVIIWSFILLVEQKIPIITAMAQVFGEPEKALVAFIVDFWFIGRVLDAGRKKYGSPQ